MHIWDYSPDALEVSVSHLLVATADYSDDLINAQVRDVLHDLREHLGMDVIFLSEIRDGQRLFAHVDSKPGCDLIATGGGSPLGESFCQCVLDGRLPRLVHDAATHSAAPQLPATPFRVGAHHWLILHGRYVCKARTPECWRCSVADLCLFRPKSAKLSKTRDNMSKG